MKWQDNFLFSGLSDEHYRAIQPHMELVSFAPGEILMEEGEPGEFMLLIKSGTVDIYKNELKLAQRGPDDLVGLMGLIEGCARSATVKANGEAVEAFKIDRIAWDKIMSGEIRAQILNNYLIYQQNTIRATDEKRLEEAREKWKEEHMRVLSARFFVQMVIGLIVFTFALGTLATMADTGESTYISFGLLFVYAAWSFFFVRHSGLPLDAFGLTMSNFKSSLPFIMRWTGLFLVAMVFFKWGLTKWLPESFGTEIVSGYTGSDQLPLTPMIILYCIHAVMQEFIARGCIQGGLHQFITGRFSAITAIFVATMMFSVFHLMMDMRFALLTIIPGLFWGYLFYKERNVLAVSISHILIGVAAIFVLGIVG